MKIPTYLAMTGSELSEAGPLPCPAALLGCHFDSRGPGLTGLPEALPEGSMLILDDSVLPEGLDSDRVLGQLSEFTEAFRCTGVLLDFQRPVTPSLFRLAELLTEALPCPAAVSEAYADSLSCPVFVAAPPAHVSLERHLARWKGRELWLELAPAPETAAVTASGTVFTPLPGLPEAGGIKADPDCRCRIALTEDSAVFTLFRNREDLAALLTRAEALGVTRAVGLWQELRML